MSERLPGGGEPAQTRLTITHDEAIADSSLREQYYRERLAAKKEGQKVWMIRGFHGLEASEPGVVYDLYQHDIGWGFIEGNDLDGYDVYGVVFAQGEHGIEELNLTSLSTDGPKETMLIAQKTLEDYVTETRPRRSVLE